jgi:predicted RNA-binding protein
LSILNKHSDGEGFNNSFLTKTNTIWYHYLLNWFPDKNKPVVFLPCAKAEKTRTNPIFDGRKFISQSTTHQFLSAITRNTEFEHIILSEPAILIPYALEWDKLRPDYNLPVKDLSIQSEIIFITRLSLWLMRLKQEQPNRKIVYYVGGRHHFFILYFALKMAGNPFKVIYEIPERGIRDYSKAAKKLLKKITDFKKLNIFPNQIFPDIQKHIKRRGRYTVLKWWESINLRHKKETHKLNVSSEIDYKNGFVELYFSI